MPGVDGHESYSNAPIVLVAVEIRHPTADALTPSESRALKQLLSDHVPIERPGEALAVQLPLNAAVLPTQVAEHFPRYMNREMTLAVSFRKEAVTVEASRYMGWQDFKALVMKVIDARMKIAPIVGIERVGVRYINEIRPPRNAEVDWSRWIHSSLLGPGPIPIDSLPLGQWQGLGIYGSLPGNMLVFRYGPRRGFAVDPGSDLRQAKSSDGSLYFLMDIDSFWTAEGSIPEYDRDKLDSIFDELHEPVYTLFEEMITDELREEVLRSNA